MAETLAEAIERAFDGPGFDIPRVPAHRKSMADSFAAAVLAWMQQPAQIERLLSALVREMQDAGLDFDHLYDASERPLIRGRDDVLMAIRAAVAALAGGEDG